MPGLGRLPAPDPRDHRFMASEALAPATLRNVMHPCRHVLDQGNTGSCVGHGWKGGLLAGPVMQGTPTSKPTAFDIYCESIGLDEFNDNDGDCAGVTRYQFGTSVRAGAKALQKRGLIGEYRWAFDAYTAIQWLIQKGPVIAGTEWLNSMFHPDPKGYLQVDPRSGSAGGHCYLVIGYSKTRDAVRIVNSWGRVWGESGRAWIAVADFDYLVKQQGEICMTLDVVSNA